MMNTDPSPPPGRTATKLPSWLIAVVILGMIGLAWWQNHHEAQSDGLTDPFALHLPDDQATIPKSAELPDADLPTHSEVVPETEGTERAASGEEAGRLKSDTDTGTAPPSTSNSETPRTSLRPSPPSPPKPSPPDRSNPNPSTDRPRATGPLSGMRTKPSADGQSRETNAKGSDRSRPSEKTEKSSLQLENQTIRDINGRVVFKGTIDLKPTLERIDRGEFNRHRNDGSAFQNRENRLPRKPAGYYREYVHPTPGDDGPGPQRVILGKSGEVWYTPDHYKSFKKIK